MAAAAVAAGWGWVPKVRLDGALVPKLKPPPGAAVVAAAGAAAVVAWTLVDPKLNPPNERPPAPVVAVTAAVGAAARWRSQDFIAISIEDK